MNKRQLAAIAGLVVSIISILELPAEARRRFGGYRSYRPEFRAERGSARRYRRPVLASSRRQYYQPASYTLAQVDRSGASAPPPALAARSRRSIPQGDDRFPLRSEPNLRSEPTSEVTEAKANSLNNYAKNQPYQAMRKLLGKPSRRDEAGGIGAEVYDLKGTSTPFQAPKRLVVHYQRSPECNCTVATSWHQE